MPEPDDDLLDRLADDVRVTAPQPRDAFVQRLEQRAEQGFPKPARSRPAWFLRPALGVAACALVALVVAAAALNDAGSDDQASSGSSGAGESAVQSEPAPEPSVAPASPPVAPPSADAVTPGPRRAVERTTQIELGTGEDDFAEVTAGVLRIADTTATIVQRSSVTERDGRGFATYDLRVPSSRLDEALAALSRLADVRSRSASTDDITGAYVSARDRLQDARAERRALLRALGRTTTDAEREAVRARLRDARARIAAAERDVRRVRARVDRARVDVTVRSTGEAGAWTPGDALDDARRILEVGAGVVLVALAVAGPPALLLALLLAGRHATRRRRREAALG